MTFITATAEETGYAHDMTTATENRRKAALRRVQFLKTLPDEVLDAIARAGTERRLDQGELLFGAIGSRIGTVREVVSRTLHSFKDAGVIRLCGRTIQICDETSLMRLSGIDTPADEQPS